MEVGVRNDFCRQASASPAVRGWLSRTVPALCPACAPPGRAGGGGGGPNTEAGASLGHTAAPRPWPQPTGRDHTGGAHTEPDPQRDRGVILASTGFETTSHRFPTKSRLPVFSWP